MSYLVLDTKGNPVCFNKETNNGVSYYTLRYYNPNPFDTDYYIVEKEEDWLRIVHAYNRGWTNHDFEDLWYGSQTIPYVQSEMLSELDKYTLEELIFND